MGDQNRGFIHDFKFDDSTIWAFYGKYLGGSVSFDVDVSEVECACVAGVYLVALNDEKCHWNYVEEGSIP